MKIVDANILLYVANEDADHHQTIVAWWETAMAGDETIGLPWLVLLAFLRISTNPKIFPNPLATDTAVNKIQTWLSQANTSLLSEKSAHWEILRTMLAETGAAGNLTTDAHLATLAISHGATLVSCDSDFARFKGLRWENPISNH